MKLPSVRRLAMAAAALSLWGVVRHRRRQQPGFRGGGRPPRWPVEVRSFVHMLHERGVRAVTVRREEAYGAPHWVVEWGRGRSLTFPDPEGG